MNSTLKRIETFVIVVIIAVIGVAYAFMQNPAKNSNPQEAQTAQTEQQGQEERVQLVPGSSIQYQGVDGKNAVELLKLNHRVTTKEFSGMGEYVVGINGVESDSANNFWSFYVNGQQSPVGASQYITKNGDILEWKLETIN
jgi:hypothetical protein